MATSIQASTKFLESLSDKALDDHIAKAKQKRDARIYAQFGEEFINTIGLKIIKKLPAIDRDTLGIKEKNFDSSKALKGMGENSIVRGRLDSGEGFVVLRIQLKKPEKEKVIGEIAEIIFREGNQYKVMNQSNRCYYCGLCSNSTQEISLQTVSKLLREEVIFPEPESGGMYWMQLKRFKLVSQKMAL